MAERTIMLSLTPEQAENIKELVGRVHAGEFWAADVYRRLRLVLEGSASSPSSGVTKEDQ